MRAIASVASRSRKAALLGLLSACVAAACAVSCRTLVLPPAPDGGPRTAVHIVHYVGHHNSLVLPDAHGLVEYSFGDWDLYARYETGWWNAVKGMTLPTRGALGRRRLPRGSGHPLDLRDALGAGERLLDVTTIEVRAERVQQLRRKLDGLHGASEQGALYNPHVDLHFVRAPASYAVWHTCNHELAGWLVDLGCRVRGGNFLGNFEVVASLTDRDPGQITAREVPQQSRPGEPCAQPALASAISSRTASSMASSRRPR